MGSKYVTDFRNVFLSCPLTDTQKKHFRQFG